MKGTNKTIKRLSELARRKYPNIEIWEQEQKKKVYVSFTGEGGKVYTYKNKHSLIEKLGLQSQYFVMIAYKPCDEDWGNGPSSGNVDEYEKIAKKHGILARYENEGRVFFVTHSINEAVNSYSLTGFDLIFDGDVVQAKALP